jgi:hypothetical protein
MLGNEQEGIFKGNGKNGKNNEKKINPKTSKNQKKRKL